MNHTIFKLLLITAFWLPCQGLMAQKSEKQSTPVSAPAQKPKVEPKLTPKPKVEPKPKPKPLPIALHIARVNVVLNVDPHHASEGQKQQWKNELQRLLTNSYGQTIQLKISLAQNPFGQPMPPEDVSPAPNDLSMMSKTQIEIFLSFDGSEWEIRSRGWLALTNNWMQLQTQKLRNAEAIPRYLAEAVESLYLPVFKIDEVEQKTLSGTLAGGEFSTPDESIRRLKSGDTFGVVMLYFDRKRQLKSRQILPWTYLEITERNRAVVGCNVFSTFRSPIPKSRRRVEVMAYRIHDVYSTTDVDVLVRATPNQPFRLTKVFLTSWAQPKLMKTKESTPGSQEKMPAPPRIELTSSRLGTLQFSRNEIIEKLGPGLVKIEVMSDSAVVARVPWLPGSSSTLELTVPDDAARRDVRIQLDQLKTELLRVTAKRATLMAALKKLADDARKLDPTALFEEVDNLPSRKYFIKQINLIRVPAVDDLISKRNRTAARDVGKMCEETESIVDRYLDQEPIEELKLRLNYIKKEDRKK